MNYIFYIFGTYFPFFFFMILECCLTTHKILKTNAENIKTIFVPLKFSHQFRTSKVEQLVYSIYLLLISARVHSDRRNFKHKILQSHKPKKDPR